MRFSCNTNDLNASLSIVSRALAVRSPKPILEGILFESCEDGLRITCTDLALGIETVIPASFSEEGRAVLPGKLLCEIVPQPISIDAAASKLKHRLKNFG